MSASAKVSVGAVLEWLKEGGILALTVIGILLYIFLSVPATIFYGRLGTTPGEVGISYTSLLSGSTLGVFIILIFAALLFIFISFLFAFVNFSISAIRASRQLSADKQDWEMDDEEFEQNVIARRQRFSRIPEPELTLWMQLPWPDVEHNFYRVRELQRLGVRTAEQSVELDHLISQRHFASWTRVIFAASRHWIRRRRRGILTASSTIVVIAVLPVLAFVQAGEVLNGNAYYGSQLGIFDYRAQSVSVSPASQAVEQAGEPLVGKRVFLLGQNGQYVVFYLSATHSTVRVPTPAVIVASDP
jgi:hypothetical protein